MLAGSIWREASADGCVLEEGTPCNLSVAQTLMAVIVVLAAVASGIDASRDLHQGRCFVRPFPSAGLRHSISTLPWTDMLMEQPAPTESQISDVSGHRLVALVVQQEYPSMRRRHMELSVFLVVYIHQ